MAHTNYSRSGNSYIVKGRGRQQYMIETIKGRRRVSAWEKWKGYRYCNTLGEAESAIALLKKAHGLTHFAIFHHGKRLSDDRKASP